MTRKPIRSLTDSVVALIAAGEVIERPATVVKELIENALDAGATQLSLSLKEGGKTEIFIQDNGHGIPAEELSLAVQSHTTNKISDSHDLLQLVSYGFRGEALASIGTVSTLILRSRPADQATGSQITVDHGKVSAPQTVGMVTGTQIFVQDLFAKIPARRKFLKSATQERRAILELVTHLAIAVPEVGFTVTEADKVLLFVPPEQTIVERITHLFGDESVADWWPFAHHQDHLSVTGVLGSPRLARRQKAAQYVVVNRRSVTVPAIITAVREAYGSSIEPKAQPAFVLYLQLDPSQLDVNIHPRKETVQWQNERQVLEDIRSALQQHLTVQYQPIAPQQIQVRDSATGSHQLLPQFAQTLPQLHGTLKSAAPQWYHALATRERTVLQVHNTYLLSETDDGFMIVDQHAAHERILYNQFVELFHQQLAQKVTVELSPPVIITLRPAFAKLLEEHLDTLGGIGCEIEPFGNQTFAVRSLPELLKEHNPQRVIEHVLEDIANDVPLRGVDQLAHRTLAYLACRSAVKAGDPLTQAQAETLLEKLQTTEFAFSCPHGRPTIQVFTWHEVEKWFKRK